VEQLLAILDLDSLSSEVTETHELIQQRVTLLQSYIVQCMNVMSKVHAIQRQMYSLCKFPFRVQQEVDKLSGELKDIQKILDDQQVAQSTLRTTDRSDILVTQIQPTEQTKSVPQQVVQLLDSFVPVSSNNQSLIESLEIYEFANAQMNEECYHQQQSNMQMTRLFDQLTVSQPIVQPPVQQEYCVVTSPVSNDHFGSIQQQSSSTQTTLHSNHHDLDQSKDQLNSEAEPERTSTKKIKDVTDLVDNVMYCAIRTLFIPRDSCCTTHTKRKGHYIYCSEHKKWHGMKNIPAMCKRIKKDIEWTLTDIEHFNGQISAVYDSEKEDDTVTSSSKRKKVIPKRGKSNKRSQPESDDSNDESNDEQASLTKVARYKGITSIPEDDTEENSDVESEEEENDQCDISDNLLDELNA
jgi:hypothetical protein